MTTSPEAPELIQYSCERCKTRFVLPPSSRKLGVSGMLRAFSMGIGRSFKTHQGLGGSFGGARRELLAKMDDEAYQAFVLSFRFCHECRQFVCNDCWSKSRGTCMTCAAKATSSPARIRPVVTAGAAAAVPDIPRPIITRAPQRRGRTRRDFGLVGMTLAIVLVSIEGGVLLLNATTGPTDVSAGQTQHGSPAPGSSAQRQWIVTPPPDTPGVVTPGSTDVPVVTTSDNPTGTLAPGATPRPGTTRRPSRTLAPGETPPPATPTPTGAPTPTPAPGVVNVTGKSATINYGDAAPSITDPDSYSPSIVPAVAATCSTTYVQGDAVGSYPVNCSGASDPSYTFNYFPGAITVSQASMTITASSPPVTYGAAVPPITATFSPNVDPGGVSCTTTYNQGDAAGSINTTSCTGGTNTNYTYIYSDGSVSVAKRTIHVTCVASPDPILVGDLPPSYSLAITSGSFYPGDTWTPTPSCTGTYNQGDLANTYAITCSASADGTNYTVILADGTLTVNNP